VFLLSDTVAIGCCLDSSISSAQTAALSAAVHFLWAAARQPTQNVPRSSLLRWGVHRDDYRETMAGKLGTSTSLDLVRMSAAIAEFTAARILTEAGYEAEHQDRLAGRGHAPATRLWTLCEATLSRRSATPRRRRRADSWRHTVAASPSSLTAPPSQRTTGRPCAKRDRRSVIGRPLSCARARTDTSKDIGKGSVPIDLSAAIDWV